MFLVEAVGRVFRRVSDLGSRRLYKSVLKQIIGPYLDDELDLDQLDINLSDGTIHLNSLTLKPKAVNELLQAAGIPVTLRACTIEDFKVVVSSWGSILEDGCDVHIDGVCVDIVPNM